MPYKAKPVVKVGTRDWQVHIPRPPKHATHARMVLHNDYDHKGRPKMVTLPICDMGCFQGVTGDFYYIRMDKKQKILQEWLDDVWYWNGKEVADLPEEQNE